MASSPADDLPDTALPPPPLTGFLVAWIVFWMLLMTVAVQDHLRQGRTELWKPLLWEGTAFIVASLIVWSQWRHIPRHDHLLRRPWRWFAANLIWLPPVAVGFVVAVYALRHGVHSVIGEPYLHDNWGAVFRYETVKFAVFYALFVAIFFGIRSHAAMDAERLRAERARALSQRAQLLQLTQQIEPHFLFNALNTIAATIHTDPGLADTLLTRLAALLRAATDLARQPHASLDEELRLLEGYAVIMHARFAGNVTVRFEIDAAARTCRLPTLALQPLLENAFRHGVERRSGPATIVVSARRDASRLVIAVEDDVGVLPDAPAFGVGLSNLQQRLAASYGERAALTLSSRAGGGVVARIELPCEC